MAETEASPHITASLDAYVLRPLQRASSIMGSGDLWQRAADMDEVVAAHGCSVASTAATTTNEGAATGKKWSVMGSTARKVQRMLFADKSDKSAASIADRKNKRLLPSLLSSARRQERAEQDLSLRVGSCRVESAESVADDGGEDGADLYRRSASFQHLAVDSYHGEMAGREATSVDEREDSEPGGADPNRRADCDLPEGRAEGVDFISLSPRATSATNATGVPEGVDRPCSVNKHSASPPESNSSRDRIVSAPPRPVRPQTAPSKSAASPRYFDARDPIFSRRKTAPVAPAVLRESGAASGELKPQLADEPLLASASDWSSAALSLVAPPPPPIDTPPALPLPSPVVPRPPSSDGVGNRSGRLRAGRGRAGGRAGEGLRVDVAGRRQRSRHSDELAWAEALGGQGLVRSKTAERDAGARGRTGGEVARVGRHHHLSASWDCEGEIGMGREDKGAFPVRVESLDEASWGSVSGRERPTSSGGRVPITAVSPRVVRQGWGLVPHAPSPPPSPSLPPSPPPSPSLPLPPRYSPSCRSLGAAQVASVAQWCTFNIIMILVNNEIFQRYGFAFPLTLTAIHFALSFVGAFTAIEILQVCPKAEVEAGEMVAWVMPMAVVTCFNVVLGQLSLRYVPLPALLSTKALSPGLTVAIQALALQAEYDWRLCLSLLPVMAGAMLAYAPSVHFALPTFLSALCCVVLGCATVICAEVLLKGKQYSLDSLNALYQLVPYSALILAPPAAVLEGWQLWGWFMAQANPWPAVIAILISGCFAFCLNFSLFYTIQKTSALTFNVAGNLKLVITLIFSWLLFRTPMAPISLLGCLLELVGVVCYGWAIFSMRKQQVELLRSPSAQVRVEQEASDDIVQVYLGAML
ncbi:unnamed protein product [Closterium sp. Naga37s-1]|nr:unnamed protein product [Closterium sp. Naga37s-1]